MVETKERIGAYIATLFTRGTLTESQAEQTAGLLAVTNSISRIADRCHDVEKSCEQILKEDKKLSNKAKDEIADCIETVVHLFTYAMRAIAEGDASVAEQLTKDKDKMLYNIDRLADNCASIVEEAMDHIAYVKLEETGTEGQVRGWSSTNTI